MIDFSTVNTYLTKKNIISVVVFVLILVIVLSSGGSHQDSKLQPVFESNPTDIAGSDGPMELINKLTIDLNASRRENMERLKELQLEYDQKEKIRVDELKEIKALITQNQKTSVNSVANKAIEKEDIESIVKFEINKALSEQPMVNDYPISGSVDLSVETWIQDMNVMDFDKSHISIDENKNYFSLRSNMARKEDKKNLSHEEGDISPKYTIPRNATLMDARLLTPLIGRVPVDGKITSPYPFKLIVGSNNLASNGVKIPNLKGIVASGESTGDMALSCARGEVHSLTFTFEDGTIVTETDINKKIGFISSDKGNPCLPGEFITNASEYIATQGFLSATEGAGKAFSESQTSTITYSNSAEKSKISGSIKNFMLGNAASDVSKSTKEWHRQRIKDAFDVVYVPQNTKIAFHIEKEIPIDISSNSRKVNYEHQKTSSYNRTLD